MTIQNSPAKKAREFLSSKPSSDGRMFKSSDPSGGGKKSDRALLREAVNNPDVRKTSKE